MAIESLESGDGAAGIAEFAVVVIFQNQRAGFAGGFEKLEPARETHRDADGKLVTGSDIHEAGVAQGRAAQLNAFFVQRHVRDFCAERLEDGGRADVSGIFHADAVAGIQEETRDEIEGFLRARDNRDLIGDAIHGARGVEVIGDGFAERQVSERLAAHQKIRGDFAETARGDLRP